MDGSGKISYNEFLSAMISSKKVVTEERLEKAFNIMDKDGSGKLSVDEIKNIFGGSEEQWKKVINEVDLNKDTCADCPLMVVNGAMGKVNYICAIKELVVGRTINAIYNSKRPDWCPLKVVEESEGE
jgi:hypothetical protein